MLIAVAGPYSADTEEQKAANLKAMNIAATVYRRGHIPVIGVNASLNVANELADLSRAQVISDLSFAIVERCDVILMIGSSPCANIERSLISAKGLPVYNSIGEIPEAE